jgi:hypothetical protein
MKLSAPHIGINPLREVAQAVGQMTVGKNLRSPIATYTPASR